MAKAPIWSVDAPGTRKPRFTREQIAQTALEIADADGFEALSMRRVADRLGAGTMTLYYYVRTKEDLLALVEDALLHETCEAAEPLPKKAWRAAIRALAHAMRDTYLRHPWVIRTLTNFQIGPNALRHIEQSLQAVASLSLSIDRKRQLLSIVDDYVTGYCASAIRKPPALDRKSAAGLAKTISTALDDGDYPELRALIGDRDPVEVLVRQTPTDHFDLGLDALLDGLAKRFNL